VTIPIYTFCVAFHIFVVGEHRDFKFGVQVDHRRSQHTGDKLSLTNCHVTHFIFLVPLKYLGDGLSQRLQILYFRLTSNGHDHGHVASLNFGK